MERQQEESSAAAMERLEKRKAIYTKLQSYKVTEGLEKRRAIQFEAGSWHLGSCQLTAVRPAANAQL